MSDSERIEALEKRVIELENRLSDEAIHSIAYDEAYSMVKKLLKASDEVQKRGLGI